jgi:hypothetical protein
MQLYQLEEQLKRMREQGADDYTDVTILYDTGDDFFAERVHKMRICQTQSHMGKRYIQIEN